MAQRLILMIAVLLFCTLNGDRADAQRKPDTTEVGDRQFLRLLQKSRELNEEQKWRAKRTTNPRILSRLAEDEDAGVRFFV
jgi:hypothetical protein